MYLKRWMTAAILLTAYHTPMLAADARRAEPVATEDSTPATSVEPQKPVAEAKDPLAKVLSEVNFENVSLEDAVAFLQDADPHFKAVIVRNGVPDDYPQIKIKLKDVTLGQIWMAMQSAHPELAVEEVQGTEGPAPIYIVRVNPPEKPIIAPIPETSVKVYRLGPVMDVLAAGGKQGAPKAENLGHVLSLLKATLAQVPGGPEPVIQVHEETQTLIFNGTTAQKIAVEQVLSALDPQNYTQSTMERQYSEQFAALSEKLLRQASERSDSDSKRDAIVTDLKAQLAESEKASLERMTQAERLKVRLEAQSSRLEEQAAHSQAEEEMIQKMRVESEMLRQENQDLQRKLAKLTEEMEAARHVKP